MSFQYDVQRNKSYREGQLLFYIPSSVAIAMNNGVVQKKIKYDWIKDLEIFDFLNNSGNIFEFEDALFNDQRKLAKKVKKHE